jgi:predicted dehydrogenase/aryl-alcohol dehydrogenase-like predicted oxidoreductase
MATRLNWGILSTARIAGTFTKALAKSRTGTALAVASRSQESADKFANEHNIPRRYASYEAMLADKDVQAVYIATPHPMHPYWCIQAARAGKHILCEKPIALNHADAMAAIHEARLNDVFLMEAYMYRCHPQAAKLVELIRAKVIGDVRVIQATFGFHCGWNPQGRLLNNAMGGGGILDVGGYAMSMARMIAGAALGGEIAEPIEVKAVGKIGASNVDDYTAAVLKFPGDIVAQVATGVQAQLENVVRIFGADGNIYVPTPWVVSREGGASKIIVTRKGAPAPEEITVETGDYLYAIEADTVAANIERRQAPYPAMSWDDTLGNMRACDAWREAIGLVYEAEKPGNVVTVDHEPLAKRADAPITTGTIRDVGKPVSRLVMGVDNQRTLPHAAVMFDEFFRCGGNCFDTAWIYGGGSCEKVLGQWVRERNIRQQVVILDKGAHTPFCTPKDLSAQLVQSLERLGTDYLDIYMMHRDNPAVPVGEFVEVLNEHKRAGRMKAFGVSNWTLERVQQFNAYAAGKGLSGIAAVSNNFSLAVMEQPVWANCLHNSDAASIEWFARTQMPLMPWSSQARGFFLDHVSPDYHADASLERCWYSQANFGRLARARELAGKRGVRAINIALAYVLRQPFPTFPLIGPRTLEELRTSLPAMSVELSPAELKWLSNG